MMQLLMIWFLGLYFTLDEESVAMVYFANMNVWEEIQPGPTVCPLKSICDVCIKGVLYWPGIDGVIRFDLNSEVFYFDRFPAHLQNTKYKYFRFGRINKMNDSIAVFMSCDNPCDKEFKSKVHLWIVDDGFERSWTLKFSINVYSVVDWVHGCLNNSEDILFETKDATWLYNSEKRLQISRFKLVRLKCSSTRRA